jgi:TetR/AcrR family transcriptional repressor of nem operon
MGRKREFDPEAVLDRAIEAFWAHGYEATSVQDLVDEMGINRGSLYDTFGDKHSLFLAAIDRYYETVLSCTLRYLDAPGPARDAIEMAIRNNGVCAGADAGRRGCLLTNSAVELAPHCHETAEKVATYYRKTEDAFASAIARARAEGGVTSSLSDRALAEFITCCLQGLVVISKVDADPCKLNNIVDTLVATLDG